ncbi:hypothetical protein [Marinobacter confluentis]|uniref:MFS transporter permease n=1 Tax=Marinobacter confluentis TaxID=1697557 RepID=A0A4Z1BM27_9GAMM|nr:hypothetical protein [Marinobacter confluentis]TGN41097.1 hypothetical protein E5Q11_00650 [Marinobacter confluentis]
MFGPQVFLRLFVRINQDLWPWPLLAVLAGILVPMLLLSQKSAPRRVALGLASVALVTSGYGFLVGYFGPINWPALWFGWGFVLQGVLLGSFMLFGGAPPSRWLDSKSAGYWLAGLWLAAVLALPWLTVAESGDWKAVGLFGLAPGTTAAAGVLLAGSLPGFWRWLYLAVPFFWSLFSAATFWSLQTWWLLGLPVATLILSFLAFRLSPSWARSRG